MRLSLMPGPRRDLLDQPSASHTGVARARIPLVRAGASRKRPSRFNKASFLFDRCDRRLGL